MERTEKKDLLQLDTSLVPTQEDFTEVPERSTNMAGRFQPVLDQSAYRSIL
jgi:hypothetical protein